MTDTENTPEAPKPRAKKATPAASGNAAAPAAVPATAETTAPTTPATPAPATPAPAPARGPGRGILIGALAATLVGGLGIGGVGGFALATAVEHHAPAFAGQADRDDRPGGEQGEHPGDDHRMPGQPPAADPGGQ